MDIKEILDENVKKHPVKKENGSRKELIHDAVGKKEAIISKFGALATWTPPESTGRSPKDTVTVKRKGSEGTIDWDSPYNIPIDEETFNMVFEDAIKLMNSKKELYITDRVIGADNKYALPVRTITDKALTALFTDNMFRERTAGIENSIFYNKPFDLVVFPYDKLDRKRYEGRLRKLSDGKTSNMIIAFDYDRRMGIIIGSAYMGSVKKLMFTAMNYYLPEKGILPLHCSANEGEDGASALFLGLSGTGKTTLSADPSRALLGDDEHGWSDDGIANFENGCYAKMININPEKEPEIYKAVMHEASYEEHGSIVENAMIYPDGTFDYFDNRLTENSRASYPLVYLSNIKKSSTSGHPKTIVFLTADANGVLPPVAKLNEYQAMLWFLMGYTSKLAGTETGIVDPVSTFSRFFGEPFMPRNPNDYAELLGKKMKEHGTDVYLINTGWTGGPYGVGKRFDINITRKVVEAAVTGKLKDVEYFEDNRFHLNIPKQCPGDTPADILNPKLTWDNGEEFEKRADKLAQDFSDYFDKVYGNKNLPKEIVNQCPGK
jgi:phosphoenolpyruvate carboxykinase (ATP)